MTRWNIATIFFIGVSGQRREVTFVPNELNIITGASGTGKSTLIKAVDYCLGSKRCELPAHVRRRCVAVGVKWVCGDAEMIVGRVVPPVGLATSTHMFTSAGRDLELPRTVDGFDGATTLETAKAFIERAFGIGDLGGEPDGAGERGRATVRHVTPYMFVTKEVIYSESTLLHGLERADKARDIIAAMPYFLRATDEASAKDALRLRQLRRALESEEMRRRSRAVAGTLLKQRAIGLLDEAHRLELAGPAPVDASEASLLSILERISEVPLQASAYPNEGELGELNRRRRAILTELSALRRRSQALRVTLSEASGFSTAVARQRDKLNLLQHFALDDVATVCPVCDSPSERGRQTAADLKQTLSKVREESVAVERVTPRLEEYDRALAEQMDGLGEQLRRTDAQLQSLLRQTEEAGRLVDLGQLRAHLLGRISFFLESSASEPRQATRDLDVLHAEIAELEARVDREATEIKLRRAESRISQFASEAFASLPTVAPCVGSELEFSSRQPEVVVIEADSGAVLRLPDVGSDQNYLAIHIALSFSLQRYFELVQAPVPGLLVLDQISRPYFPQSGENADETEITGGSGDEDVEAMRRHIEFLFAETARRSGLQVILIEHAYFADDPRYVAATRERWTKASGRALIPLDWPARADS